MSEVLRHPGAQRANVLTGSWEIGRVGSMASRALARRAGRITLLPKVQSAVDDAQAGFAVTRGK
jgi:hypothetical protein